MLRVTKNSLGNSPFTVDIGLFPCYFPAIMARPLRIEYAGAVYHITSRGNEKKAVFKSDQDRINFLNTLQHVNKRYNWICHAYCPNILGSFNV